MMISPVQCSQSVSPESADSPSTLSSSEIPLAEEDVHRRLGSLLLLALICSLERLEDGSQVLPGQFDHLLGLLGLSLLTGPTWFLIT